MLQAVLSCAAAGGIKGKLGERLANSEVRIVGFGVRWICLASMSEEYKEEAVPQCIEGR